MLKLLFCSYWTSHFFQFYSLFQFLSHADTVAGIRLSWVIDLNWIYYWGRRKIWHEIDHPKDGAWWNGITGGCSGLGRDGMGHKARWNDYLVDTVAKESQVLTPENA